MRPVVSPRDIVPKRCSRVGVGVGRCVVCFIGAGFVDAGLSVDFGLEAVGVAC